MTSHPTPEAAAADLKASLDQRIEPVPLLVAIANLGAEYALVKTGQHPLQPDLDTATFDYVLSRLTTGTPALKAAAALVIHHHDNVAGQETSFSYPQGEASGAISVWCTLLGLTNNPDQAIALARFVANTPAKES